MMRPNVHTLPFILFYIFLFTNTALEIREDVETVLEPGMVVSMEPMVTIPDGQPGAGGYREHDILVVSETGSENITQFPFGPEHHIIQG